MRAGITAPEVRRRFHPRSGWLWVRRGLVFLGIVAIATHHEVAHWTSGWQLLFELSFMVLAVGLIALPWLGAHISGWHDDVAPSLVCRAVVGVIIGGALCWWWWPASWLTSLFGTDDIRQVYALWWQLTIGIWGVLTLIDLFHQVSTRGWNPAILVVLSFAALIAVGTVLLMLPIARNAPQRADLLTALFTATSAVCVTGLTVVDTGSYWSATGQTVIMLLIQLGGLGMMTLGAFLSLLLGSGLQVRELQMLGDLLERQVLSEVRRLLIRIVLFTLTIEACGAALLWSLWPDKPWEERLFFSLFHAISAFCNAGFSLLPRNFEGYGLSWQVWGVIPLLIILGGLGFSVLDDLWVQLRRRCGFRVSRRKRTLSVSSRLVLVTTAALLIGGTLGYWVLEVQSNPASKPWLQLWAEAWFHAVSARTAGFNVVDIGQLREPTWLWLMALMFVGASPGSTGGGVKTVSIAVIVITLRMVLLQREEVEVFRRTIPRQQVYRAALIVALSAVILFSLTLALDLAENRPGRFLQLAFEVQSALATVGLSTGITPELTAPGRLIIILAMFVGRVGPLTLILALRRTEQPERYRYPEEHVILG
ncbi:MAG: Trk family potassium uptake protein [Planctomycetaceae bacterium]|nr:MAG: Trk family potassium uptake protein [Planctomycetaceae bacterium]